MKCAIFCDSGFESACLLELKDHKIDGTIIDDGVIEVELDKKQVITLYYSMQSALKILVESSISKNINDPSTLPITIPSWLQKEKTLKASTYGFDDNQQESGHIGARIKESVDMKVNLSNPNVNYVVVKKEKQLIGGYDLAQVPLYKRDYRIFTSATTLRSTFAYSMLRHAGYSAKASLIDPFCGSGTIPIEAALFATKTSPLFYRKHDLKIVQAGFVTQEEFDTILTECDKKQKVTAHPIFGYDNQMRKIRASRHNAKIAGILDATNITKASIEWIDTKNDKVDFIITEPPLGNELTITHVVNLYHDLFKQAELMLNKDGTLVLCTNKPQLAEQLPEKLTLKEKKIAYMGKEKYYILLFKRK